MKNNRTPRSGWLALLLLGALCWAGGCAVDPAMLGGPGQEGNAAFDGRLRQSGRQPNGQSGFAKSVPGRSAAQVPPTTASASRTPAAKAQSEIGQAPAKTARTNLQETQQIPPNQTASEPAASRDRATEMAKAALPDSGTVHRLTDSNVPNPLRRPDPSKSKVPPAIAAASIAGAANPAKASETEPRSQYPVQTVGYQEEIPIVQGERIPEGAGAETRLAMLEEPESADAAASSVLEETDPTDSAAPEAIEFEQPPVASNLPMEEEAAQEPAGAGPPFTGTSAGIAATSAGGAVAQGHYQQGTPVYGQLLNEPQQTASQRAVQLLDENKRLREEMKEKLKAMESLQARLKQQDELWARARQEFLEVRSVVDNLNRENSLLKMQIEKLESEKVELAKQYQNLMQTVEQTLDDLLLKAITEPPSANPRATSPATAPAAIPSAPPAGAPPTAAPPIVAPPIIPGQQASSLIKSSQ